MFSRTPSYRLHKPSGQAVVTLSGRDYYLGPYGSPESRVKYDRLVAEWLAGGRCRRDGGTSQRKIVELILAFDKYAEEAYPTSSREPQNFRYSLAPLRELYGQMPADEFGPKALKAVQRLMISKDWCRNVINRRIGRIKTFFKWCESEELVPPATYHALQTVRGLRSGTPGVRETAPVAPAFWADVDKIVAYCPRPVAAMLELQWLTAMRSGEVRIIRTMDLDMTCCDIWYYRPGSEQGPTGVHKNAWRGQPRVIVFGPKAIGILKDWIAPESPAAYIFSPRASLSESIARRTSYSGSPGKCKKKSKRRRRKPRRAPGDVYSSNSYAHAVRRACEKCGIQFHPYQLRHGRKMVVEAASDIDGARTVLGQRSVDSTQLYGQLDVRRAAEIMRRIG